MRDTASELPRTLNPRTRVNKDELRKCFILVNSTEQRSKDRQRARSLRTLLAPGSLFRFHLTLQRHSSSQSAQQEGGTSLLTAPPGRRRVARIVVGDVEPTSPARVDGVDLVVSFGSTIARVGYLLAAWRVGKPTALVRGCCR
jgi:hypothetical protein